jgi:hypothetical protein
MVLYKQFINELYNKWKSMKIYENSKVRDYPMEEIFILSFLKSKYNININRFCNLYSYDDSYKNLSNEEIFEKALSEQNTLSIKPVNRDMNDDLRNKIREYLLNNFSE